MAQDPGTQSGATKVTEAAKMVRSLVKAMNTRAHEANAQGQPVVYSFFGGLYDEIVWAMGLVPFYPENYAGLCAAKHQADRFLARAQAEGFSDKLCTYATCGLGFDLIRSELGGMPPDSPDGGMPKPDAMLAMGVNVCDPRRKWFQALRRCLDVPLHTVSLLAPPRDADLQEVESHYLDYAVEELREAVAFLEHATGGKMDWDELGRRIDLSNESNRLRYEAYELRKAIPSPMSTGDAMRFMGPVSLWNGTQEAVDFCRVVYDEVKHRVDNGIGVVADENYRLLWGKGVPPWAGLMIFSYFESLGAVFPAEVQYRPYDPVEFPASITHPLERLAWRFFKRATSRYDEAKEHTGDPEIELLIELIDDYKIDAMVMNRAYSCRTEHTGQLHQVSMLRQYRYVPSLILESDMVDIHSFSEIATKDSIEAFMEVVENHKQSLIK
jgi:benzoyl-CoA reductase/2-hydroxyglutaryl-CoA dehydratase subunit BcrC/BadD/HgdB